MSSNTLVRNPASEKQEAFIRTLLGRVANTESLDGDQADYLDRFEHGRLIAKRDASYLINGLLACPKKEQAQAAPGYYMQGEDYVVVVQNRARTRTYAKVLVLGKSPAGRTTARWAYAPGIGAEVAHLTPLTIDQAVKFGRLHGVCVVCCRGLTDPQSVKAGIGPVCRKRVGR